MAASCYDHLAGQLGVTLLDHLMAREAVCARAGEGELTLGPGAAPAFRSLGVELPATPGRRMLAYACMDSLVGRPHLGGLLGARLAASLRERDWVTPSARPRRLELTSAGARALRRRGIVLAEA